MYGRRKAKVSNVKKIVSIACVSKKTMAKKLKPKPKGKKHNLQRIRISS